MSGRHLNIIIVTMLEQAFRVRLVPNLGLCDLLLSRLRIQHIGIGEALGEIRMRLHEVDLLLKLLRIDPIIIAITEGNVFALGFL